MEGKVKPFLKWAGGKGSLLAQFESYYPTDLKSNKITRYIEPFLGGGAVFFSLQGKYNFKEVILNDINEELIITYKIIQQSVGELIRYLGELEEKYLSLQDEERKSFYLDVRTQFNDEKKTINYKDNPSRLVNHGGKLIFLNKTCFNGLYRQNKKGEFNVPMGNYKNPTICDVDNLKAVNEALQGVILMSGSYEEVLKYVDNETFVYLDPPYRPLNETSSFTDYSKESFNDESQIHLIQWVKKATDKGALVMYSNSDPTNISEDNFFRPTFAEVFGDTYYELNQVEASRFINSKASGRGKIKEILVTNYKTLL